MQPKRKHNLRDLRTQPFSNRYEVRIESRALRFQTLVLTPLKSGVPLSHFHLKSIWTAFESAKEVEQREADGLLTDAAFEHASQHILAAQESLSLALDAARFRWPYRTWVQEAFLEAYDSQLFSSILSVNRLRNDAVDAFRELSISKLESRVVDTLKGACDWKTLKRRFPVFPHRLFRFVHRFKRRSTDNLPKVLETAVREFHNYESLCLHVAKWYGIRLSDYKIKTHHGCVACQMKGKRNQFDLKKILAEIAYRHNLLRRASSEGEQTISPPIKLGEVQTVAEDMFPFPDNDLYQRRTYLPSNVKRIAILKNAQLKFGGDDYRGIALNNTVSESTHTDDNSKTQKHTINYKGESIAFGKRVVDFYVAKCYADAFGNEVSNEIVENGYPGDFSPEALKTATSRVNKTLKPYGLKIVNKTMATISQSNADVTAP